MKRKFTLLAAALMLLSCLAVPMGMRGQTRTEVTYTFSDHYNENTVLDEVAIPIVTNTIQATFNKRSGGTATQYYTNGTAVRWYGGGTLDIVATDSEATMSGISFTFGTGDGSNTITANEGTYENDSWTGSATSVRFTQAGTSGNRRIAAITVTYTISGGQQPTTYTVTYNANGGTGSDFVDDNGGNGYEGTYTVLANEGANNPNFTKTGNTFSCWSDTPDGTGNLYYPTNNNSNTFPITQNTTLYAQWSPIQYNVAIANVDNVVLSASYGTNNTLSEGENANIDYGTQITLSYTVADGYAFSSWVIKNAQNEEVTSQVLSGNTLTVPDYAITVSATLSQLPQYTVTFNAGNGSCGTASSPCYEGSSITLPTATPSTECSNNGWTFAGWATESVDETTDAPTLLTGSYSPTATITLYAVYKLTEGEAAFNNTTTTGGDFKIYAVVDGTNYYATGDVVSNKIGSTTTESNATSYTFEKPQGQNYGTGEFAIKKGNTYITYTSSTNLSTSDSPYKWTITEGGHGSWRVNSGTSGRAFIYRAGSTEKFGGYSTGNVNGTEYFDLEIVGSLVTYATSPSCNPIYAVEIDDLEHGTIVATPNQAEEGVEVTLTITPDECYQLKPNTLIVLDDEYNEVTVTDNKFTMPGSHVLVSAEFEIITYTVQYSVNGTIEDVLGDIVSCGGYEAYLWDEDDLESEGIEIPTGYTLAGWSTSSNSTTILDSYEPTEDAVLYAVFGKTSEGVVTSKTVILDGSGLTSTATSADYTYTNNGFTYILSAGAKQQSSSGDNRFADKAILIGKNGAYIYNTDAFGQGITSFEVYANKGASANVSVGINFSTTAIESYNASATNTWTQTLSTLDHVYDASSKLPEGAKYFWYQVTNANNSQVQFRITYDDIASITSYYTLIKDVTGTETMASIEASHLITVKNGGVLTLTGTNNGDETNLIIEDGGQLISDDVIEATIKKNITAYDPTLIGQGVSNGWYFISSPLNGEVDPIDVKNMIATTAEDYDLYKLVGNTWANYKEDAGGNNQDPLFSLYTGHGYLYANAASVTLEFAGSLNYRDLENDFVSLDNTGWNLVGNPFAYNTYPGMSYYKMNEAGTGIDATEYTTADAVPPCTGILVYDDEDDPQGLITFSKTAPASGGAKGGINLTLAETQRGAAKLDNAIVSFNEGSQLGKFYFGTQNANLYIPQGTEEYAIVSTEAQGEMPVNFRANENGQYTLTVNPENVEMNYLHLIDNMTGADIDLLQTPSYTFNATTNDYESRFKLVFASSICEDANGDNETFAFYSNGNWIINNAGEATLQVIDLTGRILSSETVNGSVSKAINATPGVYMLRLINGENVKVQKIVVR